VTESRAHPGKSLQQLFLYHATPVIGPRMNERRGGKLGAAAAHVSSWMWFTAVVRWPRFEQAFGLFKSLLICPLGARFALNYISY